MDSALLLALLASCAPAIHHDTARALVRVESSTNPWAIGVVHNELRRQPRSRSEAMATARLLRAQGHDFSVGLAQINQRNFARLGLTLEAAFDPCANLAAMQRLLAECFERAQRGHRADLQQSLRRALSCYYSGNFTTGFRDGYVSKVAAAAGPARGIARNSRPRFAPSHS